MAWIVLESIVVRIVCRIVWRICRFVLLVWIISMLVSWIISLIVSRVWMVTWPWTRILVSPLDLIFIFVSMTLTFSFGTTLSTISKGRIPFILIHLSRTPGPCIWVYVRAVVIHFPSVNEGKFARKSFFCMALTWKWGTMLTCHNHNIAPLALTFWTTLSTVSEVCVLPILIHLRGAPDSCVWIYVSAMVVASPSINEWKLAGNSFYCLALTWELSIMMFNFNERQINRLEKYWSVHHYLHLW